MVKAAAYWNGAEWECKHASKDAVLASVPDKTTQIFVTKMTYPYRTWLGGYKDERTKRWKWSDRSNWAFTNWGKGQPSNTFGKERSLEINYKGYGDWNDLRGYKHKRPSLCQYVPKK